MLRTPDGDHTYLRADSLGNVTGPPSARGILGGKRCRAIKDDGTVCNAHLSTYNPHEIPICQPCARRFALRHQKPRLRTD